MERARRNESGSCSSKARARHAVTRVTACLLSLFLIPTTALAARSVCGVDATSKIAVEAREDRLVAAIEVVATRDSVWTVLTDFDAWTQTFPEIERVDVRRLNDDRVEVAHATSSFGWKVRYTAVHHLEPERGRIDIALDSSYPHDIADLRGRWQLSEARDGATRIELWLRVDSGLPIPGFVERRLVSRSAADTVEALAREVERRCVEARMASAN